jgi:hypothetical protein
LIDIFPHWVYNISATTSKAVFSLDPAQISHPSAPLFVVKNCYIIFYTRRKSFVMKKDVILAPSLLAADFTKVGEQ